MDEGKSDKLSLCRIISRVDYFGGYLVLYCIKFCNFPNFTLIIKKNSPMIKKHKAINNFRGVQIITYLLCIT